MINLHLLKLELGIGTYLVLSKRSYRQENLHRLPKYIIAICPICNKNNVDHLDTYSVVSWDKGHGSQAFGYGEVDHCEHFSFTQPFIHFHNIWPEDARHMLGPEVPYVVGHLLESNLCLAVIHALPICRIENKEFVPSFTLYLLTYFSTEPESAYNSLISFNIKYIEPGTIEAFIIPQKGYENWWDLSYWVSTGKLYWMDASDKKLALKYKDVDNFPYSGITGRRYFHTFPYPYPPAWAHNEYGLGSFSEE